MIARPDKKIQALKRHCQYKLVSHRRLRNILLNLHERRNKTYENWFDNSSVLFKKLCLLPLHFYDMFQICFFFYKHMLTLSQIPKTKQVLFYFYFLKKFGLHFKDVEIKGKYIGKLKFKNT